MNENYAKEIWVGADLKSPGKLEYVIKESILQVTNSPGGFGYTSSRIHHLELLISSDGDDTKLNIEFDKQNLEILSTDLETEASTNLYKDTIKRKKIENSKSKTIVK